MAQTREEYHKDLLQDVHTHADAVGVFIEDACFDILAGRLVEAGEIDTADRAFHASRGLRVDGYAGDPAEAEGVLTLVALDWRPSSGVETLTASEMDQAFNRLIRFATKARDQGFRDGLEETDPAFGLADLIAVRWSGLRKLRLVLISNRLLSARVDGRPEGETDGVPITFSVWDLDRFHRLDLSGADKECIEIDLEQEFGGGIPVIAAHLEEAGYEGYLGVIAGAQLAAIYDRWGARLLEQNVRTFLQARGSVNKGIRNTLEQSPEMFFAYNNGLSATAESVTLSGKRGGVSIVGIRNLQIVNGAQTTASIYAASRKREVDLERVFVQIKVSVIEPDHVLDVVPRISEYANSQNRVNAADFFANHPFHVRIEELSRRIYAPSPDGQFRETKWFYERARGQYAEARAHLTVSERRKFDMEYPKRQLITKTDLAKVLNVWALLPHTVSTGAQKNFGAFAKAIGQEWERNSESFNELYYHEAIAKTIVFKETEKIVPSQPWYEGGYRANLVAYAIAKLSLEFKRRTTNIDFERVWRTQAIWPVLESALAACALCAFEVISRPPAGMSNVTEWAKKAACWDRVSDHPVSLPVALFRDGVDGDERKRQARSAVKDQRMVDGIEAQVRVVSLGPDFWQSVRDWGVDRRLLSSTERDILDVARSLPERVPSERQSLKLLDTLQRLRIEGFVTPEA